MKGFRPSSSLARILDDIEDDIITGPSSSLALHHHDYYHIFDDIEDVIIIMMTSLAWPRGRLVGGLALGQFVKITKRAIRKGSNSRFAIT